MATMSPTFFIILLLPLLISADKCNKDDKRALLSIKSAFNNAYHFASWTSTSACCDWYGINCDPTVPGNSDGSRVTDLFVITDSNLTGSIPSAVGDLPFLTILQFHELPNLVGNIPSSITRLTRLSLLFLNSNSLSGPIPSFLFQIPSLRQIDLSFNLFSGSIPAQINQVDSNSFLLFNVSYNQLCGQIPAGPITAKFGADAYFHNKCLCGLPLPPCTKG